jgi:signal transduction histidine kinase
LATVSLRWRVLCLSVGLLATVLLLTGVATDVIFGALSRAELNTRLAEQIVTAQQLAAHGTPARQLVRRLSRGPLHAELVTTGGTVYGVAEHPGPDVRVAHRTLADGSQLTLAISLDTVTAPQQRLRRILTLVGLAGLTLAALGSMATTRTALAPLDTMTALARSITRGQRGQRLSPTRPDTELGRTAAAFDEMLDALEGAERRAHQGETRARAAEHDAVTAAARTRQFVDDAAHELRTPIAGILAAADAANSSSLDAEQRDNLHHLLTREAHRAHRLVDDLLHLARLDSGVPMHFAPVELRELATHQTERVALLAPELTVVVVGGPVTIIGDGQQLAQLLTNLLNNARRHTPSDGTITIEITTEPAGIPGATENPGAAEAPVPAAAVITITDTGPGVAPENRDRIFERLVRLDSARGDSAGAGLGLAIARGIATAHHGELLCIAPPAGTTGARFSLTLPADPHMRITT